MHDDLAQADIDYRENGGQVAHGRAVQGEDGRLREVRAFVDGSLTGREPLLTWRGAAIAVVEAAHRSAGGGLPAKGPAERMAYRR